MSILRRSYRLFATFKALDSAFRVLKTLLKRIWIKKQPTYADALKARDQAKLNLEDLQEIYKQRQKGK